ncbi:MAG: spermidine synthase [Alphaproteobacteria bacterium]
MLLPLVGGTPAGWVVAMAFFQVMLLAGYLMAHAFSRVPARRHGLLYVLALLAGAVFLPVSLADRVGFDSIAGPGKIFLLLTQALAVPFIALSATSSTLQRLFTTTKHGSSDDPYFLYVASNLGSFAGLLLYPVIVEPLLPLDQQSRCLAGGYVLLIILAGCCLAFSSDTAKKQKPAAHSGGRLSTKRQLEWTALAFLPSSLLMAVTTYITSDIISAPLIWVLPLALYLLTFVIAFSQKPIISLRLMETLHPYVICIGILFVSLIRADWLFSWIGVLFYLTIFTAVTLTCHLRLAVLRPLDDSRHLTAFYLMMSIGGALGGVLNAFIIPNVFDRLIEFPLLLLASFMLHKDFKPSSMTGIAIIALTALSILMVNAPPLHLGMDAMHARVLLFRALIVAVPCVIFVFRRSLRPAYIALGALGVFMMSQFIIGDQAEILSIRNFFGTVRLYDATRMVDDKELTIRTMRHGSTTHGIQIRGDSRLEKTPTAYFTRLGPLGDVFSSLNPRKVAVLGLGAGVTNCYNAPDREFTFLEIDPAVVDVAQRDFTFLSKCASKRPPKIIIGDGRLELAKLPDKFDLLIIDVFTSDTIPTHIVTQEALKLYFEHISPGGVLAMNISNRYFELWSMISTTASTLGLSAQLKADLSPARPFYSSPSLWLVLSKDPPPALAKRGWRPVRPSETLRPWTDNYTNLLAALSFSDVGSGLK